jgi:FixJ family two-component response regulator
MPLADTNVPVVHIVDDDASVRSALARVLRFGGFDVRQYASAAEFLVADRDNSPCCLVLDVGLPGMDGEALQAALAKKGDDLPIIFLTGRGDIDMSVRAMKAGAVDFLTKPVKRDALIEATRVALARDVEHRARRKERRDAALRFDTLTQREREVLVQVVRGKLNKQIASDLGTSLRTVKAHRAHVMSKMQVASVAQLVGVAARLEDRLHP